MTRGDQRERDRQRASKRLAEQNKGKKNADGKSYKLAAEEQANAMREKQRKAMEAKKDEPQEKKECTIEKVKY
ncbi:hypothetical protein NEOLI_002029 [Neolecta irregularis DAH-3]|uniref:Small EDRK-rich factor-like N-terminal domain-containing protein n=1 Tax=Neolecta irregularis (strain DAH-3) TaxID=1198029 RepID=A0A1U7LTR8_NEOID|nr:hypothetical protein NEOLI_002029 [Neolecta irregularis DAH-3]|eukprot:OLL25911.1 hypothetical protein NEOLI_002029 [Neolecta irregularis DAH-3]